MASIHPHGSGVRVHYYLGGKPGKSPTLPNAQAAEAWILEHLPAVSDTSWANLVDLWRREQPSPYREDVMERLEGIWKARGWGRPEDLTIADIKAWTREHAGWRRPFQYLRSVLGWMAREHRIAIRPEIFAWKPPRQSTPPHLSLLSPRMPPLPSSAGAAASGRRSRGPDG